jgi:hypothetical protein
MFIQSEAGLQFISFAATWFICFVYNTLVQLQNGASQYCSDCLLILWETIGDGCTITILEKKS